MSAEHAEAATVDLVTLIDRLAEPPEPAPISMLPQTPGWLVLGLLVLLLLAWLGWRWHARRRANAYRRAALAELDGAGDDPAAIAEILRRTALAAWRREHVAGLYGDTWLLFLDRSGGGGFVDGPGKVIAKAPYRGGIAPVPGLRELAARWIRQHRVEPTEAES
jgi:hypothetical protein